MTELTVRLPHTDVSDNATKSRLLRTITNGCYANGFGVVSVYFPDGDTNDCDAPTDRQAPLLVSRLASVETDILNLKTELIAYRDETDPRTFRFILNALTRAGLYRGDIDAEVAEHINFHQPFGDDNDDPEVVGA